MAGEYQFSLIDVTKQAGTKTILQDVNLSFFYGAHIGVIGANGGKGENRNGRQDGERGRLATSSVLKLRTHFLQPSHWSPRITSITVRSIP